MRQLISANFFRLRKGWAFYAFLSLSALIAVGLIAFGPLLTRMTAGLQMPGGSLGEAAENLSAFKLLGNFTISRLLFFGFDSSNGLGMVAVMAVALFVGEVYSSGIIRNKIIAGHSKAAVFLSSCAVSTAFAFALIAVYVLIMLAVGLPVIGLGSDMPPLLLLRQCIAGFCITAVSASVANCCALLSRNNIAALIVNVGVVYVLVIVLSVLDLLATMGADIKPFVDAVKSVVYVGQSMLIGDEFTLAFFLKTLFSSLVSLFVINAAGCAVFNKLDIK
jgi:hypothetical protein